MQLELRLKKVNVLSFACKKLNVNFYQRIIRKFCPRRFDNFAYSPSVGASRGILVLWSSALFTGTLVEMKSFGIVINFTSAHNSQQWTLVNVYGPCQGQLRDDFVQWLYNLNIPFEEHWLLIGDFNFIRTLDNRNLPGGDINDIFLFNEIIGHLGLLELPLKGRSYTWSNMQENHLLEQLDWFFTSSNWIAEFPNTMVFPLAKTASDHVPCVVSIATSIPKAKVFRFENYWVDLPSFQDCVQKCWSAPTKKTNSVAMLTKKFKRLGHDLKKWHTGLSKLKLLIQACNAVILAFDNLEELRSII